MKPFYTNDRIELYAWDIVRLTNGKYAGIFGAPYEHLTIDNDTRICLISNPVSSISSYCYPEHVEEVIYHSGCFENQISWWSENGIQQELYICLDRGEK